MRHLTRDELLHALDAGLGATDAPSADARWSEHLKVCARCAAELRALSSVLDEVGGADVPEPSPLFWEQLSRRVSRAVEEEGGRDPATPGGVAAWEMLRRRWRTVLPAAAAVVVALAVGTAWLANRPSVPEAGRTAARAIPSPVVPDVAVLADSASAADEESWQVLAALAAEVDEAPAPWSLGAPGEADGAVLRLTDEERGELGRLLKNEIDAHGARLEG